MIKQSLLYFIIIFLISLLGCSQSPTVEPKVKEIKKEPLNTIMYVKQDIKSFYKGEKVTLIEILNDIAITSKGEIPLKYLEEQRSEYQLTVHTPYKNSRIRILNIKPKYHSGIWLKPGKYEIEVTLAKHLPYKKWINLQDDIDLIVTLKRKPNTSMGFITWQEIEGVKYIDKNFWQDQAINKQKKMTWENAQTYCENLKIKITDNIILDDFDLPTKKELLSLSNHISKLDYVGSIYWSSSTDKKHDKFAQYVYINSKKTGWYNKSGSTYVRCISRKNYPLELSLKELTKYLMKNYSYNYIDAYEFALNLQYGKPIIKKIHNAGKQYLKFDLRSQKYNKNKKYFYNEVKKVKIDKYMTSKPTKVKFEIINDQHIFRNIF